MIPFDFEYYRPESTEEAVELFLRLDGEGKAPVYYGGGTELLSMARVGNLAFGAVIDLKAIPACRMLAFENDTLLLGSACTLSDFAESDLFPLLGKTAGRIADHTIQGKITLGGNLASTILYRETALPLLLTDAKLETAGENGPAEYAIARVFRERLTLRKGEFLVRASVEKRFLHAPCSHVKITKNEKIDYPLLTAAALKIDGRIRLAFSGLFSYPFRDAGAEAVLNDFSLDEAEKASRIAEAFSGRILQDLNGSAQYRKFVLKRTVLNILERMREA